MKHTHSYKRTNIARKGNPPYFVYACSKPDCGHYVSPSLVIGKTSECSRCGGEFIVTMKDATLKEPHCEGCTRVRETA